MHIMKKEIQEVNKSNGARKDLKCYLPSDDSNHDTFLSASPERARQRFGQHERMIESRGSASVSGVWGWTQSPQ